MENLKASYILSKKEILFLVNNLMESELRNQAKYFFDTYLAEIEPIENSYESLIEKNLAKSVQDQIIIEPVIEIIIKSICQTNFFQSVRIKGSAKDAIILGSDRMHLLLTDYGFIPSTWKITPYKNHAELMNDFSEDNTL